MARTKAEGGISGLQKAAILLIALGPERSAGIFKHLKEEEIEILKYLAEEKIQIIHQVIPDEIPIVLNTLLLGEKEE